MKLKPLIKLTGIGFMFATLITMMITFVTAYIHPSKKILININVIGEATWELWGFSILSVFACIATYWIVSEETK